ncbi:hypothetical protein Baya_8822 [Bagarius yarrelli]|uniref:Uncharacterized protein n=1 Tax=Bagarius yarrelli TaxID=175774 RepID=A0A556U973_BAGYA|nr:hypothetical protein Baya_8822 [Bagarius yarrelli]
MPGFTLPIDLFSPGFFRDIRSGFHWSVIDREARIKAAEYTVENGSRALACRLTYLKQHAKGQFSKKPFPTFHQLTSTIKGTAEIPQKPRDLQSIERLTDRDNVCVTEWLVSGERNGGAVIWRSARTTNQPVITACDSCTRTASNTLPRSSLMLCKCKQLSFPKPFSLRFPPIWRSESSACSGSGKTLLSPLVTLSALHPESDPEDTQGQNSTKNEQGTRHWHTEQTALNGTADYAALSVSGSRLQVKRPALLSLPDAYHGSSPSPSEGLAQCRSR